MIFPCLYLFRKYLIFLLFAGALFFLHCTTQIAGGSSSTDNPKVTGIIIGDDHRPASHTQVFLIPENFNPLHDSLVMASDTTDSLGRFELPVPHSGIFNIQAVHLIKKTRLLIRGILVSPENDSVNIASDTLKPSGAIRIELPDSIKSEDLYLYIPGTMVFAVHNGVGSQGLIDSVPVATLPSVCYVKKTDAVPTVLRYNVHVDPGATTVLAMPDWKYSERLYLHTLSSGVTGDVLNFPVLVQLNSENFIFSQVKENGADIRFTKENGSPLPFEIERWDAVNGQAAVWVKVDTVYGNNDSQFINMYWGNSASADSSNGAAVFDSATGFQGVWHLNETSGTQANDATYNNFSGTYLGKLPNAENYPSGICQRIIQGDSDYIDMGNVLNPGTKNISIGVWIKPDSSAIPQALVAKSNGDNPSTTYGFQLAIDTSHYPHFFMASGGTNWGDDSSFNISSNLPITDTSSWHYVFVVIDRSDNSNCKMYIDGVDRTGYIGGNVTSVMDINNEFHLRIGLESDSDCPYGGAIGEVTIAFTTRSADWIRLSFVNQKESGGLVVFGKD